MNHLSFLSVDILCVLQRTISLRRFFHLWLGSCPTSNSNKSLMEMKKTAIDTYSRAYELHINPRIPPPSPLQITLYRYFNERKKMSDHCHSDHVVGVAKVISKRH